jgi:hypothetical protein
MKSAQSCLDIMMKINSNSKDIEKCSSLLYATDELSNFSLTLTPGIPLKPVELKETEPLRVIHRVLELNEKSYHKLDLLTKITYSLCRGLDIHDESIPVKVRAMCVEAALVDANFIVAYDYCVPHFINLLQTQYSEIAWTTCFQVGKFVSPYWDPEDIPKDVLESQLTILSHALTMCPQENIPSVLSTWKKIEWLLIQKLTQTIQPSAARETNEVKKAQGNHRVRKRDQISNLLVSGLGWAIVANPPNN